MESSQDKSQPVLTSTTDVKNPTAGRGKRPGRGHFERKSQAFGRRKNAEFQAELQATLLRRLHVTDPTNVSAIKLQSTIVPSKIPISYRGLPVYIRDLWSRMKSIGTRPFAVLATDANFMIFLKCIMYICEAKLAYAQIKCQVRPVGELPSSVRFTEMELRVLSAMATRLPYPVVIYLEAIGNFQVDEQYVVPVLIRASPDILSGAVNCSPTNVAELLFACREPIPESAVTYEMAQELDEIPGITWEPSVIHQPPREGVEAVDSPGIKASADTIQFWSSRIPTPEERGIFYQIISSMDSKKGFNLQCDITTGEGSIVQAIRFPEPFEPGSDETLYYSNVKVPTFEEQLAPALMLGFEYRGDVFSRYCGSYEYCLKHGSAYSEGARHAIIWANSE